ncbi:MAG: hypothetical protein Q4G04_07010, partial [bacterium]|nr:hypothetical protein [bacterium]
MIKTKRYEEQSKRYITYMLLGTILFLCFAFLGIKVIDVNSINSFPIIEDLNSINIIIGIIAIPSCLLYYYMYRNNEFFILTLSYVSIFIEYIYVNFIIENIGLQFHLLTFPFIFRIFLLTIAIFNESKYASEIVKRKRLSVILVVIINIIGTYIEINLYNNGFFANSNYGIIETFQFNILMYYGILLILLAMRCIKKREFIYTIFITTISIFTIRRIFYFEPFLEYNSRVMEYNKGLTFIAYIILLIGLYIEIVRRIEESARLNNQVSDFNKLKLKYK